MHQTPARICYSLKAKIPLRTVRCSYRLRYASSYLLAAILYALPAAAQTSTPPPATAEQAVLVAAIRLPDSPGAALQPAILNPAPSNAAGPRTAPDTSEASPEPAAAAQDAIAPNSPVAHRYAKFIDPGQHVERLSPSDKVKLGLGAAFSPFSAFGWVSAATYSQALDSSPNYGQGWAPYGQRLGAAAARGTSEGIFSDSVFAPLFHEDPRYYRLGPGKPLVHRALYAVTRTVITRTDDRRTTPNFALLAGNAAVAILTNAYYPSINRNATTTVETFAGSVGGSALGFFVREFLSDTLAATHLRHTD